MGYAVPANAAGRQACCRGDWDGGSRITACRLEPGSGRVVGADAESGKAALERAPDIGVFVRFEAGRFDRAAAYSLDCEIDAGGRQVIWLTGVKPAESVAWLRRRAEAPDGGDKRDGVVMALAFHAEPSADASLERLALTASSRKTQQSAVFWLGAARGAAGFAALKRLQRDLSDDKVREQVMFAFSISKEPASLDALLDAAKNDRSAVVRGQALFWLGQKAGEHVAGTIAGAVRDDPDTDVKKRAVFALSRMPKDEGVPRLIDVARTNKNAEVRKQAMFWLGQSKDPRALAFFEEVLGQR
jgi:HEAT repeat protein